MTRPHRQRHPVDWPLWRAYLVCVASFFVLVATAWLIYLAN